MHRTRAFFSILALLSLAVGLVVYAAVRYSPAILVIEANTGAAGTGRVFVEGTGGHEKVTRPFAVDDSQGEVKQYLVELPATRPQTVSIAPLGSPGTYGIDRLILSGDAASLTWDGQGGCRQKTWSPRVTESVVCSGGSPVLTPAADGTLVISALPDLGFERSPAGRTALALCAAVAFFLAGTWLARPVEGAERADRLLRCGARLLWLVVAGLYLYQLYAVCRYAVDVPFQDEWRYFNPDALPQGLTWHWLVGFHNDHRLLLTKLMAWLNLKLFNLDFTKGLVFNYLLFGGLLYAICRLKERLVGKGNFVLFPAFVLFLLSPVAFENHAWGFQAQIHWVLLFSVVALSAGFGGPVSCRKAMLFSLAVVLGIYNFSAGIVFAGVYLLGTSLYLAARAAGKRLDPGAVWRVILLNWAVIGGAVALWFCGYEKPAWSQPWVLPADARFWDYFLNILSLGFGFQAQQMLPGMVCLAFSTLPLVLLLARKESRWQPATWQVLTAIFGVLAVLAVISMGRTGLTPPKTSRYAEIGFLLVPYASLAWWLAVRGGQGRAVVLSLFWLFCCFGFRDGWSTRAYAEGRLENMEIVECAERYYLGEGDGACQEPNPVLKDARIRQLDLARQMNVNFIRNMDAAQRGGR